MNANAHFTHAVSFALIAGLALAVTSAAHADPRERRTAVAGTKVKNPTVGPQDGRRREKKISTRDVMKWSWKLLADRTGDHDGLNEKKFYDDDNNIGSQALSGGNSIIGFLGSTSTGTGTGATDLPTQVVTWSVTATGTLGGPDEHRPKWQSQMSGKDPFYFTSDELSDADLLGEEAIDIWFPVSFYGGASEGEGSTFEWDVDFNLAGISYDLYDLAFNGDEFGSTSHSEWSEIEMWALADINDTEHDAHTFLLSDSMIESALLGDMDDGFMDSEMSVGFLIKGVPVADVVSGEAFVSVESRANAGAAIPAPGTIALASLGALTAARRRR